MGLLMRPIARILLILALSLVAIGAAGIWYVNRVFFPVKVRGWAETAASEALGRKVTIGKLEAHLWHGIVLKEVTIEEDSRYGGSPFLEMDRVSGGILFLSFLKNRVVVIPALHIAQPRARLIRDANGLWNMESLRHGNPSSTGKTPSRFRFLVSKIVVENGQLITEIRNPSSPVMLDVEGIHAQAHLSLPAKVECSLLANLLSEAGAPVQFKLEGVYEIPRKEFQLKSRASIPLNAIPEHMPRRLIPYFPSLEGTGSVELDLKGNRTGPFSMQALVKTEGLRWKLRRLSNEEEAQEPAEWLQGQGDFHVKAEGEFSNLQEIRQKFQIRGTLELERMSVGPVPTLGQLEEISGPIAFDSKGLRAERLTARLSSGQTLEMAGQILNDAYTTFSLRAQTTLPVAQIPSYFPKLEPYAKNATLLGEVSLLAEGSGRLRPNIKMEHHLTANLRGVGVQFLGKNIAQDVHGKLSLKPDLFTVTQLEGQYDAKPFSLQGSLINFSKPEIDAQLSWGKFSADVKATLDGTMAQIHELSGRYQEATFRLLGEVTSIPAQGALFSGGAGPVGNLYGELEFDLENLPTILNKPPVWLWAYPMKGHLSSRWLMQGNLLRSSEWKVNVKTNCPYLTIRGIPLEQLAVEVDQEAGKLLLQKAQAEFSGGALGLTGSYALHDPKNPWTAALRLQGLELKTLARTFNWKVGEISGKFFAQWDGTGQGNHLETVSGNGSAEISGARILELPFLGQFADLLKLPTLRTIAFEEAEGPFFIEEGELRTKAFLLKGPQATLTILGSGGFLKGMDSPINWTIIPTLPPELIPEESRSQVGKVIAVGASYLIGEIRITGTWKEPKRAFVSKPMTQILNEQIFNLQDLFRDLF